MRFLYVSLLINQSCSILSMFPDNPVEEEVEDLIQEETGIKVDFTGATPEKSLSYTLFQF